MLPKKFKNFEKCSTNLTNTISRILHENLRISRRNPEFIEHLKNFQKVRELAIRCSKSLAKGGIYASKRNNKTAPANNQRFVQRKLFQDVPLVY